MGEPSALERTSILQRDLGTQFWREAIRIVAKCITWSILGDKYKVAIVIPRKSEMLRDIVITTDSFIPSSACTVEFCASRNTRCGNVALVEARDGVTGPTSLWTRRTEIEIFPGLAESSVDLANSIEITF